MLMRQKGGRERMKPITNRELECFSHRSQFSTISSYCLLLHISLVWKTLMSKITVCVCVCVRERERERKGER